MDSKKSLCRRQVYYNCDATNDAMAETCAGYKSVEFTTMARGCTMCEYYDYGSCRNKELWEANNATAD